ncbi:cation diffusion facilitator family transporter [Lysobacter enzymogenes]|uniref:Cation diffusion facilitator family transporter n=1 Tax=Lysobacter enzymogenes TaxID=69 RepID=A0A0S2DMV3_LYSEN|nr:cation diffusion facilitator family transporter [Lysobacter enzymogenes]QCW27965.1 cation transporter [Lysobacter enzymogenes]QQQ02072.1 cation transporter [Lysobacter enzymogenes]UZW61348.1 cation diffusion facilitator family transporter [Lysobacter enzymogenes]
MGSGHDHGTAAIRHEKPLWWALGLTGGFLIAEVIGAFLTNSLALLSDAAHMGTDTVALMIALTAVRLSRRPADAKRSFGYARMEAMGAMANGLMLFVVAGYILYEAVGRFAKPAEIATTGMLVIASLGLAVNLIAMRLLRAGSGESLNMKGAYLEVWSDMLGSVAVIAGAIAIRYTGWAWIDPVLAVLIGLWVLPRTWTLLREAGNVLMEGVPKGIDLDAVRALLASTAGVAGVHDLHVWSLGSSTPALTAHLVVAPGTDGEALRRELTKLLDERYGIEHCTLQIENEACEGEACDAPHA